MTPRSERKEGKRDGQLSLLLLSFSRSSFSASAEALDEPYSERVANMVEMREVKRGGEKGWVGRE